MKKLIVVILGLFLLPQGNFAATNQASSLGLVRVQISSATLAIVNQTTPLGAFELIGCTDCVQAPLCISTGTGTGAYVVSASSHGLTGPLVHCR